MRYLSLFAMSCLAMFLLGCTSGPTAQERAMRSVQRAFESAVPLEQTVTAMRVALLRHDPRMELPTRMMLQRVVETDQVPDSFFEINVRVAWREPGLQVMTCNPMLRVYLTDHIPIRQVFLSSQYPEHGKQFTSGYSEVPFDPIWNHPAIADEVYPRDAPPEYTDPFRREMSTHQIDQ